MTDRPPHSLTDLLTEGNLSAEGAAADATAGFKADPWAFDEPFAPFAAWMADAEREEINDPNAMALATVDADGLPDVRMVLLKGVDPRGFVFYSNADSAKGRELAGAMRAALVLHWKSLRRQVRIRGPVEPVTKAESDDYFATRSRGSRIAARVSQQSRPLTSRATLEAAVAVETARLGEGEVPRPDYWIGYRVRPLQVEFWQDMPFRLHDRVEFRRDQAEGSWRKGRLFP